MYSVLRKEWGKALADSGGGEPPCDYCGWGGDNGEPDEPDEGDAFEVIFDDEAGNEWCPECGRQTLVAVYFDDDPRAPWNRSPEV